MRGVRLFPLAASSGTIASVDPVGVFLFLPDVNCTYPNRSCLPRRRPAHHAQVGLHGCKTIQSRAICSHRDICMHWERLSRGQKTRGSQETGGLVGRVSFMFYVLMFSCRFILFTTGPLITRSQTTYTQGSKSQGSVVSVTAVGAIWHWCGLGERCARPTTSPDFLMYRYIPGFLLYQPTTL